MTLDNTKSTWSIATRCCVKEKPPTSSAWVSTGVEIFPPDIHVRTGEDRDVGDVTSQVLVLAVRVDV